MLSLYKEFSDRDYLEAWNKNKIKKESRTRSEIVNLENEPSKTLSLLGLFFIAPFVLSYSNSVISIPIRTQIDYESMVNEISGHFNIVNKLTKTDSKIININIKKLRVSSRELFIKSMLNNEVPKFITDIYGEDYEEKKFTNYHPITTKKYEIDLGQVEKSPDEEFLHIWRYISSTYLAEEPYFMFTPNNWDGGENLKDRLTIKNLASVCNKIWVNIDTATNRIITVAVR
ncbi:hypothetical protein ACFSVM_19450 [Paenibacillus shunpengii]|uniref:Uncharacterized protein n=1 Tax=Paenibacillus shunpengii TaxID=2054424 RepID=A0ABW5SU53_9BACL